MCMLSVSDSRVLGSMGTDGRPLSLDWAGQGVNQANRAECVKE